MKKSTAQRSKKSRSKKQNIRSSFLSPKRFSYKQMSVFVFIFAVLGGYFVWGSFAAPNTDPPRPFVEVPERGLIWAGLKAPQAGGPCGHLYELASARSQGRPLCTHGPDPAPDGVVISGSNSRTADTVGSTTAAAIDPGYQLIPCEGDGSSGNRVQGLYVRPSDVPSRLSTVAADLQVYARRANQQFLMSAQQTGSNRNIRWVHDTNCMPIIPEVVIPSTGDDDFNNTITELQKLGYNRPDRKYLLWMDSDVYCGIGNVFSDDDPSSNNVNNGIYNTYGRSDYGCWNYSEAHELMHNLGSVQSSAPHATPGWHCTDESDEMCYADGLGIVMTNTCPSVILKPLDQTVLFDCNHDDYYYAGTPPAGNYLATHWNTANSSFLIGGGSKYIPPEPVQCNNGRDDDGDFKIDYPTDPGCTNAIDTSESPDPPPPDDVIPPTAYITQPANNAKVRRSVGIYANGSDNIRVIKMEIYIDGTRVASSDGYQVNYTWNLGKVTKTSHTIMVKAYDAKNVGQTSITVTVTK